MGMQIRPDGNVVITDCRLFRAGVLYATGFELGLQGADERKTFNTYCPPHLLSDERFLKKLERLPVILGHLNCVEARHYEGTTSAARFDGEWVIADLTINTVAVLTEIFVHRVTDLSLASQDSHEAWPGGSVFDRGLERDFEYLVTAIKPTHIAIVPIGRVEGARLNL
ncbi:DUF2213 domain-containing protein [Paraburkholderia sp. UYCP14C]|uniref:DUF2213 domain-containing protein n=1 Tax=Paraburkholderia sp. UYCP14C TaxID=2511130 RepID=UPI00101EC730|nr:DUF2213 domain-containing protein [Paraburkholderia sp. UYCP14C]RZF31337.1 DUF2213 domain-containing protein [Paraburkholderia sp. UYCP14C]